MEATHQSVIHARCPVDSRWDYYTVEATFRNVVLVEDFEAALDDVRGMTAYQESLAEMVKDRLPAGAVVKLTGRHGKLTTTAVLA